MCQRFGVSHGQGNINAMNLLHKERPLSNLADVKESQQGPAFMFIEWGDNKHVEDEGRRRGGQRGVLWQPNSRLLRGKWKLGKQVRLGTASPRYFLQVCRGRVRFSGPGTGDPGVFSPQTGSFTSSTV